VTWALLRMGHTTAGAEVEGRSTAPSSVDRPKLIQGVWVRSGGVVVEAAFANTLGLHVGDRLSLAGSSFEVTGTAVTAAIPDYPDACFRLGCFLAGTVSSYNPGLVWATEADAGHIAHAPTSTPLAYFLNLKLNDPAAASAFADRYNANGQRGDDGVVLVKFVNTNRVQTKAADLVRCLVICVTPSGRSHFRTSGK